VRTIILLKKKSLEGKRRGYLVATISRGDGSNKSWKGGFSINEAGLALSELLDNSKVGREVRSI